MSSHSNSSTPVLIILAAGLGKRFRASGGQVHKLQALLNDQSVLTHVLNMAKDCGLPWHVVEAGAGGPGMGDSIAAGVRATANAAGWLILPGDLPLVQAQSVQHVAAALMQKENHHTVVMPSFKGEQGHPVAFGRACLDGLLALSGEKGAAAVVRDARAANQVLDLPLDDAGIITDIDTLEDLARAETLLRSRG